MKQVDPKLSMLSVRRGATWYLNDNGLMTNQVRGVAGNRKEETLSRYLGYGRHPTKGGRNRAGHLIVCDLDPDLIRWKRVKIKRVRNRSKPALWTHPFVKRRKRATKPAAHAVTTLLKTHNTAQRRCSKENDNI